MTLFLKQHFEPIRRLFLKYGIKSITMDDICSHLGISKKTLYNEYANKEELVHDIFLYDFLEFKEQILSVSKQSSNAIEETCELTNLMLNKHRSFSMSTLYDMQKYYCWLHVGLYKMMNELMLVSLCSTIKRGMQEKCFREDLDSDRMASILVFILNSTFFISNEKRQNTSISMFDLLNYHFRSICSTQGLNQWEESKSSIQNKYPSTQCLARLN